MAKTISLTDVPDSTNRQLLARAASCGLAISEYLVRELRKVVEQLTPEQMCERLSQRESYDGEPSRTAVLRKFREDR